MSVIFKWSREDIEYSLNSCERDTSTPFIMKYLPKSAVVVEAGCGTARFVKYLKDYGYNILGLEYDEHILCEVKKRYPELNLLAGDVEKLPFESNSISGVICLGVIEHFILGLDAPLKEIFRVLKPGGIGIISVPSYNLVRKVKSLLYLDRIKYISRIIKRNRFLRKLFGKPQVPQLRYNNSSFKYRVYPEYGSFFEYRLTKKQFEDALANAGFNIIESAPICHIDGIYHEFGKLFVKFEKWKFSVNRRGDILNSWLSTVPFCHNHMHLCVVSKPISECNITED